MQVSRSPYTLRKSTVTLPGSVLPTLGLQETGLDLRAAKMQNGKGQRAFLQTATNL